MTERKVHLPSLGSIRVRFTGVGEKTYALYERRGEFDRQRKIRHLGLIAETIECATHSRYEYVLLQCGIVQILESLHKGNADLALGTIKIDQEEHHCSEILKTWFLLSNYGHLRKTLGDERALLNICIKFNLFRTYLLKPISDSKIKEWCEDIIARCDYINFHFILAFRRLYCDKSHRKDINKLIKILKLLFMIDTSCEVSNYNRLEHLRKLFIKIRALSILSLDSAHSHLPIQLDLGAAINTLSETEQFHIEKSINDSIKPLTNWLFEEIYRDKQVLADFRAYEISVENKISIKNIKPAELLRQGLKDGFVHDGERDKSFHYRNNQLINFCRFYFPSDYGWNLAKTIAKVKSIMGNGGGKYSYIVDTGPLGENHIIDLLVNQGNINQSIFAEFLFKAAKLLNFIYTTHVTNATGQNKVLMGRIKKKLLQKKMHENEINSAFSGLERLIYKPAYNRIKSEMLSGFRSVLWGLMRAILQTDNVKYVIEPQLYKELIYGVYVPAIYSPTNHAKDFLSETIAELQSKPLDTSRAHEIEFLKQALRRKGNDYIFVCFSEILLFDRLAPPSKNRKTGIDGVIVRINSKRIKLELFEAKSNHRERKRATEAAKELKDKVYPMLRQKGFRKRIVPVKNYGARLDITFKESALS